MNLPPFLKAVLGFSYISRFVCVRICSGAKGGDPKRLFYGVGRRQSGSPRYCNSLPLLVRWNQPVLIALVHCSSQSVFESRIWSKSQGSRVFPFIALNVISCCTSRIYLRKMLELQRRRVEKKKNRVLWGSKLNLGRRTESTEAALMKCSARQTLLPSAVSRQSKCSPVVAGIMVYLIFKLLSQP